MKFKKCLLPVATLASFTLAGCQSNADDHAADVYQTDQLNTKQETKTVNIISILPAKVAVDNSKKTKRTSLRRAYWCSRWRCYWPQRRVWQQFRNDGRCSWRRSCWRGSGFYGE